MKHKSPLPYITMVGRKGWWKLKSLLFLDQKFFEQGKISWHDRT